MYLYKQIDKIMNLNNSIQLKNKNLHSTKGYYVIKCMKDNIFLNVLLGALNMTDTQFFEKISLIREEDY